MRTKIRDDKLCVSSDKGLEMEQSFVLFLFSFNRSGLYFQAKNKMSSVTSTESKIELKLTLKKWKPVEGTVPISFVCETCTLKQPTGRWSALKVDFFSNTPYFSLPEWNMSSSPSAWGPLLPGIDGGSESRQT